ncbi:MAG TPA: NADH-quinone oxidoreductase subunit N [Acidimicrobiales bacterium]|nr:NADH-quinone oxidoreductase subunit N [Acidimicrobiales bacterium]
MHLLAQASSWVQPNVDYHALAPEIVLAAGIVVLLLVDLFLDERQKWATSSIAGLGLLAALVPVLTLAVDGTDRSLFGGAYVVDNFALVLKALFLITGYAVVLISTNYVDEGDYYEGEYYTLLLCSILGMLMISSSRDLVSLFVALELLSIPAYMLAAWRKRDVKSNEAGMKYFLLGVFASAVMLYGMSLLYGVTGSTLLSTIGEQLGGSATTKPIGTLAIVFVIVGFAFKVSAVPFHSWAPDTYEGAPTPITAFLSVASKAAGFVALLELVFIGFFGQSNVWAPVFWVLAALSMTVGNLVALRQTNMIRMLAYSSIAQGGFILMPLAVIGDSPDAAKSALTAVVTYLIIYAVMNIGAFAVVIVVARKTRSGEISSFGGLFSYAPGLCVALTFFLFSLAGTPPLAGWVAKFVVFRSLLDAGGGWAVTLAVIGVVNSVIALFYYAAVAKEMWMNPAPDGDVSPIRIPPPLLITVGATAALVLLIGIFPSLVLHFSDLTTLASGS